MAIENKKVCIFTEMWSEAIKMLKGEYTVRAIKEHKMDQAIIFCRTKIDCDNMEQYFIQQGGGRRRFQVGTRHCAHTLLHEDDIIHVQLSGGV